MLKRPLLLVLALALLAGALRLPGLGHLLPHVNEPDAYLVHQSQGTDTTREYPQLWVDIVDFLHGDPDPLDESSPPEAHLERASAPFLIWRLVIALVGIALVPMTYVVGRRLRGTPEGLLGAGLVAASPVLALYTTQARPHGLAAAMNFLAVLLCMELVRRPSAVRHLLAALGTGLAIATFHSGVLVLPAYLLAAGSCAWRERRSWQGLTAGLLGLGLVVGLPVWSYGSIESGTHAEPPRFEDGELYFGGHTVFQSLFNGGGFLVLGRLLLSMDPLLLLLALGGLLALAVQGRSAGDANGGADGGSDGHRPRGGLVFAAYGLPTLLVLGSYEGCRERFFLLLVPVLAVLGAMPLAAACRRLPPRLAWLALLGLLPATLTSARLAVVRARPDTYELAAAWLDEHPSEDLVFALNTGHLPVHHRGARRRALGNRSVLSWRNYQKRIWPVSTTTPSHNLAYATRALQKKVASAPKPKQRMTRRIDEIHARYVLFAPDGIEEERATDPRFIRGARNAIRDRRSRLVARFQPFRDPEQVGRGYEYFLGEDAWLRLWQIERLGPVLELHDLRPPRGSGTGAGQGTTQGSGDGRGRVK